jgi:hypothetical protein
MWISIINENQPLTAKTSYEKLVIKNEDCYFITIGNDFCDIAIIERYIDRFSEFLVFLMIDSRLSSTNIELLRNAINKNMKKICRTDKKNIVDTVVLDVLNNHVKKFDFKQNIDRQMLIELVNEETIKGAFPMKKNKEILREITLDSIRALSPICAVNVNEKGEILEPPFPSSTEINDFITSLKEKSNRNLNIDMKAIGQMTDVLGKEDFKTGIINYMDFLKYDFSLLYNDEQQSLNLLKIFGKKYIFELIRFKDGSYYIILTNKDNEFKLNMINKDEELVKFVSHSSKVYQIKIVNHYIDDSSKDIPLNFISRVKENIGIAFPTIISQAQQIIGSVTKIDLVYEKCSFAITQVKSGNVNILCNN